MSVAVPPAFSMACFADRENACARTSNFFVIVPIPRILTPRSFLCIIPFWMSVSGVTASPEEYSRSMSRMFTEASFCEELENPRCFGTRSMSMRRLRLIIPRVPPVRERWPFDPRPL